MLLHALAVVDTPLRMQQTERAGHLVEAAEPFVLLLLVLYLNVGRWVFLVVLPFFW
jgi:hypothetical protein